MEPSINRVCGAAGSADPIDVRNPHPGIDRPRRHCAEYPGPGGTALCRVVAADAFVFHGTRHIYAFVAELGPERSSLRLEIADPSYRARGTGVVGEGKLCLLAEATSHAHWPCFFIYNGVQLWRALVLDGILLSWGRDVSRAPIAMRTIGFRLGPLEPDPETASRRFDAALAILSEYFEDDRLQRVLPEWVADQLLEMPRDLSSGALRVPMEHGQAVDETTLTTSEPPDGPRRRALEAVQGLFRDAITTR